MRPNVLTVFVLSVCAAVVFTAALPVMIGGLEVQRRADAADISIKLHGKSYSISSTPEVLNTQVYHVLFPIHDPPLLAIKYSSGEFWRGVDPYGEATVAFGRSNGARWYIREPPPVEDDLIFFTLTPQYQELVEKHGANKNELIKGAETLLDTAAALAADRVHQLGRPCWQRMGGTSKLNDFMFSFNEGKKKADVLMVSMTITRGSVPHIETLHAHFKTRFIQNWQKEENI